MTSRTRYFIVGSVLTLVVGLGIGVIAYTTGFTAGALAGPGGPAELQLVPADAALIAYADVHDIMTSDLRQRVRAAFPIKEDKRQELQDATGINIETDIDHVVVAVRASDQTEARGPGTVMVLARGRFDQVKIEALMREHGASVDDYKGTRLVIGDTSHGKAMSLAFVEPGLVAVGGSSMVRGAVDLKGGGASIATNDEMMALINDVDSGNAWAAGRFDALTSQARFPADVAQQLPSIRLFTATANIDSDIRATLRAESRDEESANSLRDVVRGFLALAKLQSSTRPEFTSLLQSLQLGGTGKTVSISFELPGSALEALAALQGRR